MKRLLLPLMLALGFPASPPVFAQSAPAENQPAPAPAPLGSEVISTGRPISPESAAALESQQTGRPYTGAGSAPDLDVAPVFGQDFGRLQNPVPLPRDGLIQVLYFFQYDVPSAIANPVVSEWRKTLKSDTAFASTVASSGTVEEAYAGRVFFALSLMGKEEDIRAPLLKAIADDNLDISKPLTFVNWLSNQGIDGAEFQKQINSNQDIALTASLTDTTRQYEVAVVPFIVIDGRYWVRPRRTMTPARFVHVADYVLGLVRLERDNAKKAQP